MKKYIVYHDKDEKGRPVYVFGIYRNGDITPLVRFTSITELHTFLADYDLDEVLLLEKSHGDR